MIWKFCIFYPHNSRVMKFVFFKKESSLFTTIFYGFYKTSTTSINVKGLREVNYRESVEKTYFQIIS